MSKLWRRNINAAQVAAHSRTAELLIISHAGWALRTADRYRGGISWILLAIRGCLGRGRFSVALVPALGFQCNVLEVYFFGWESLLDFFPYFTPLTLECSRSFFLLLLLIVSVVFVVILEFPFLLASNPLIGRTTHGHLARRQLGTFSQMYVTRMQCSGSVAY